MEILTRLSHQLFFRQLIRRFGLTDVARKLYFAWARPKDGILRLRLGKAEAKFCVHSPGELRILESMGGGGGEDRLLERLLAQLRPGNVVYDVGGHVGLYTMFLAQAVGEQGQVVTFEPDSQNHRYLLDNLELNGLKNVRTFPYALGEQDAQGHLYAGEVSGNRSLLQHQANEEAHQLVTIVQGDQLVERESLPTPRLVKIDVEGYEYAVLQGLSQTLSQPDCEFVCCEVHPTLLPAGVKPDDVFQLMTAQGFTHLDVQEGEYVYHALGSKSAFPDH